nr:hypothetical protein pPsy0462a_00093 [Pseudomonas syringae]
MKSDVSRRAAFLALLAQDAALERLVRRNGTLLLFEGTCRLGITTSHDFPFHRRVLPGGVFFGCRRIPSVEGADPI